MQWASHRRFCSLYALLVVAAAEEEGDKRIFKNPDCAACNGIPANRTRLADHEGES